MRNRRLHGPARGGPDPDRGPAAPRVPRLRLGRASPWSTTTGDLFVEKRAGKLANLQTAHRRPDAARGDRPGPHPLGDPRPARTTSTPIPTGLHRRHHGHPQRDHRELPGAARRPRGARATSSRPRPTRRPSPTSIEEAYAGRPRRGRPRRRCARSTAPTRIVVMHRGEPDRLVGARLNVPLVVGLGDGESFLASDVAAILAHTRPGHLPRGGRRRRPPPGRRRRSPTSTARRASATMTDDRLDARGRREGRLRALHAQGDPRAARRRSRQSIAGRVTRRRPDRRRRARPACRAAPARSTGSSSSPAARAYYARPGRRARRSRTGPACPARGDGRLGVPLQPAAARRATRWSSP